MYPVNVNNLGIKLLEGGKIFVRFLIKRSVLRSGFSYVAFICLYMSYYDEETTTPFRRCVCNAFMYDDSC